MRHIVVFACVSILFVQSSQASWFAPAPAPAPALYIFGDSVVDAGNNNNNPRSRAKANFPPFGIDFPAGPTGRFTNGQTIADLFASALKIPAPPAFIGFNLKQNHTFGFNYASAASGILDESGKVTSGWNLSMKKQVKLFGSTVQKYLPLRFQNQHELRSHLSKSIFLIVTGSNDYAQNYLLKDIYNTSQLYNPISFADHLINEFTTQLLDLYKLGARRFVVFEIGPLGCLPITIMTMKPPTKCVEDINKLVNIFNVKLALKLTELSATLKGSPFVIAKTHQLFHDLIINPIQYGLVDSTNPCCPGLCKPNEVVCKDRNSHVFWDSVHPTEATNKIAIKKCFHEGLCVPMKSHTKN